MSSDYDFIEKISFIPNAREIVIDTAVEMFQETRSQDDFDIIIDVYNPRQYQKAWFDTYGFLFDYSWEDFDQEYMECFFSSCVKYKPKLGRKLNSYFYGTLKYAMINILKGKAAQFRNLKVRCPLCEKLVVPLSTHLLRKHPELADELYEMIDKDMSETKGCPFCPTSYKKMTFKNDDERRFHTMSKHSSLIFDMFNKKYPGHNTNLNDPAPSFGSFSTASDSSDDTCLLEDKNLSPISSIGKSSDSDGEALSSLISSGKLSPCQMTVAEQFLYEDTRKLPSFNNVCEICKIHRNTDECPRGEDFKLTRNSYKDEVDALGYILKSLI